MIIDFRKNAPPVQPLLIDGIPIEQVNGLKILGSIMRDDLSWVEVCKRILTKARHGLYFLRKLKSFNVKNHIFIKLLQVHC